MQLARESDAQFSSVGAALADDGRGLVVWASRRPQFAVTGVHVAADGTPRPPVVLSAPGDHAAAPLVGMAADGEAVVAWRTGRGARGVSVCVRPATGGPCAVQRLSSPDAWAVLRSLAVAPDGGAIIGWLQRRGGVWRAVVAQRPAGGTFGAPRLVGPPGAGELQVAIGASGEAALAFTRAVDGRGSELRLASWRVPGSPGPAARVSPRDHRVSEPRVAVNEAGDAVVAWQRVFGRYEFNILHARFRHGPRAALGPVRRLGPPPARRQASTGDCAVAAAVDRLALAWTHLPAEDRDASQTRVAQWHGGSLTRAVLVSDRRYSSFDQQIAAAGDRTVVTYREYGRPGVRDGLAIATFADDGGLSFGALAGLSDPSRIQQSASHPRLALAPSGAGLAVFTNYGLDGSAAGEVAIARLPAGRSAHTPPP